MKATFRMLAQYNEWANARLIADARKLTDEEYHRDLGAFFRSVHGTLDHLLVADLVWMQRFTGEGDPLDSLDEALTEDLGELAKRREKLDARLRSFVETSSEADFLRNILYRTIRRPLVTEQPLGAALMHVFNHQTHHRGQVHAFLTMLGQTPQALDLIYFQRDSGVGMAA
ncbi:DinB family protein [Stappia sp.]|uniref:DinB family protein n=1 Tax=Stappia sp. TaxID=1870903 RepID=UPI0032D8E84A